MIGPRKSIHRCGSALRKRGVTLVESMLAMAIAAVLAAMAMPVLGHMLARQKLALAVNDFMVAVDLARSTARGTLSRVGIEPLHAGRWESGWRVYADRNGNGAFDADEVVLREFARAAGSETITSHFGTWRGDTLSFDALGNLRRPGSGGFVLGRVVFRRDDTVRSVCFSALQVRTVAAAQCG